MEILKVMVVAVLCCLVAGSRDKDKAHFGSGHDTGNIVCA